MTNTDGTCEYVLDPDDPETWGGEEGDQCYVDEDMLSEDSVWTCPHDAEDGEDLCIFHLPVEEKDDEDVLSAFMSIFDESNIGENSSTRKLQFLGGEFGEFILNQSLYDKNNHNATLAMNHSKFVGNVDWSDLTINVNIKLSGAIFENEADFSRSDFRGYVHFVKSEFESEVNLFNVKFRGDSDFQGVSFDKNVNFSHSKYDGAVLFMYANFKNRAGFENSEFRGETDFTDATFEQMANFMSVEFGDYTHFIDVEFRSNARFLATMFQNDVSFSNADFGEDANFQESEFGGDAEFQKAKFKSEKCFSDAEFNGVADFSGIILANSDFSNSDLTDCTFIGTELHNANFERTLLSRATLFNTDLRGAKLSGTVIGDIRIDENTQFLGHPSDDSDSSPHTFSAIRSRPTCVYDPNYEKDNKHENRDKAKSVYQALEELGGKHARPRLQARSFVRRQDLQRQDYWDDATADDATLEERLIAGARWSRARVARATLLYGESPWRVIAWSLGIIVSFALLYPLGGWMKPRDSDPITYAQIASNPVEILNSVYYSTLTYTALGFGDFQPVGLGRLLTTVETGLGAVMLALLVFILGRRAAR